MADSTVKAPSGQDPTTLVERVDQEATLPDTRITWSDFWDNKRVLAFCKSCPWFLYDGWITNELITMIGLLIFMLPINFGYELSTIGNLLAVDAFLEQFGVTDATGALVISAQDQQILNAATTVGLFMSAFATGFISDMLGRKKVIVVACLLCTAGIVTQYFSHNIPQLFGGKLLSCFGFGLGHSLGPVFVAELAPVKLRGVCLALVV